MGRKARCYGGLYNHITLRGIGHMDLFFDPADYARFISTMSLYAEQTGVRIFTYCLMTNHVHLLIYSEHDVMALFFKKLEVSYAQYFRLRYEHSGHLFQNRYHSEPIQDMKHLMEAVRYILHNPEPAGLGPWQTYPWSSAQDYAHGYETICSKTGLIAEMAGGYENLWTYLQEKDEIKLWEPSDVKWGITDEKAKDILCELLHSDTPLAIRERDPDEKRWILREMCHRGASVRQLERVTGLNRNLIQRTKE